MKNRNVKKIFPATLTLEGAGVHLKRAFGYPQVPEFDPFLLLDHFGSDNPDDYLKGFPWHPHRGIETVTYMIEGEVAHEDSIGNKGVIKNGDVQWMTAGSGIIHQEMPQRYDGTSKGFQLWVNLPREHKMMDPRYRGITKNEIPEVKTDNANVKVLAGEFENTKGPVTDIVVPVIYFDVALHAKKTFTYTIPAHYTVFLYIFEAKVAIGDDEKEIGECITALTNDGDTILVSAKENARFLFIAGEPIKEPIAWYGPIVMNSEEELKTAFEEYQNGTFVKGVKSLK